MKRHGVEQLLAHTVCTPAEVCEHPIDVDLAAFAKTEVPPVSALPFNETESVLRSLLRMMWQRDSHTASHCERVALSAVELGVGLRVDSASLQALYVGGYVHD